MIISSQVEHQKYDFSSVMLSVIAKLILTSKQICDKKNTSFELNNLQVLQVLLLLYWHHYKVHMWPHLCQQGKGQLCPIVNCEGNSQNRSAGPAAGENWTVFWTVPPLLSKYRVLREASQNHSNRFRPLRNPPSSLTRKKQMLCTQTLFWANF